MKKLSREKARAEMRRLLANPMMAPQSEEGAKEVVDCIMRNCLDVDHANRTMTHVLDNCKDPKNLTAEIKYAARELLHIPQTLPDGCDNCRLSPDPFTGAARFGTHVSGERNGYSCVVRCSCERGQWLARRDQERAAENPVRRPESQLENAADWGMRAAGERE